MTVVSADNCAVRALVLGVSKQTSLIRPVCATGAGLFSNVPVTVTLKPAPAHTGIVFHRVDLHSAPRIPATADYIQPGLLNTQLGWNGASVKTVEHLLSALRAYLIDNVIIEISGEEVPILGGNSVHWCQLIEAAGIENLREELPLYTLSSPLTLLNQEAHIMAIPSTAVKISYTVDFPQVPAIGTQFWTYTVDASSYKREVAPARTFAIYEQIEPLIQQGLIQGGSLDCAMIFKNGRLINESMFFTNEVVRHKLLDFLGDQSLCAHRILCHYIVAKSSHALNGQFARLVKKTIDESL
jgi:UDP-3-O-[3-hydroxymyristoyl] N-acetylglucosamine deacetylase